MILLFCHASAQIRTCMMFGLLASVCERHAIVFYLHSIFVKRNILVSFPFVQKNFLKNHTSIFTRRLKTDWAYVGVFTVTLYRSS